MTEFEAQLLALRPQLLRFARAQLRNDAWAADAVSDTLLAALEKPASFDGRSKLGTWLVGILKHKLIDQLRRHAREATVLVGEDGEDLDPLLFAADGHWSETPPDWGDPERALRQREFFEVLEACVEFLPPTQGRAFMLREWIGLDTDEICQELSITSNHLWVLLHRARLRLRLCLQDRWFASAGPT